MHTVECGDTFFTIARKYGITLGELFDANPKVDPNCLHVGDILCIPKSTDEGLAFCRDGTPYTVQRGDSFYLISRRFNIALADLLAANAEITPEKLAVGQVICVPGLKLSCPAGYTTHTLTQGQSFVDILAMFNLSYGALAEANSTINLLQLAAGQTLCVPPNGSRGICYISGIVPHVIQRDETISTIATQFKTTVNAIMMANPNLTPTDFVTGRIICLPKDSTV